jgi:hypothetical protein
MSASIIVRQFHHVSQTFNSFSHIFNPIVILFSPIVGIFNKFTSSLRSIILTSQPGFDQKLGDIFLVSQESLVYCVILPFHLSDFSWRGQLSQPTIFTAESPFWWRRCREVEFWQKMQFCLSDLGICQALFLVNLSIVNTYPPNIGSLQGENQRCSKTSYRAFSVNLKNFWLRSQIVSNRIGSLQPIADLKKTTAKVNSCASAHSNTNDQRNCPRTNFGSDHEHLELSLAKNEITMMNIGSRVQRSGFIDEIGGKNSGDKIMNNRILIEIIEWKKLRSE